VLDLALVNSADLIDLLVIQRHFGFFVGYKSLRNLTCRNRFIWQLTKVFSIADPCILCIFNLLFENILFLR